MINSPASMLKPLQACCLSELPNIRHGFFTRQGGVSEGLYAALNCGLGSSDDPECVLENRNRVARHLQATHEGVVTLFQIHGATALTVVGPQPRQGLPKADAVVTRTPGLAIGVLTADCTPVLFADPEAGVVAAAHAGWRGAAGGILESAIIEMERQGARRDRIRAALGPAISAASYEVGPDFENEVLELDPPAAGFFRRDGAKPHFDLPGYVYHRLSKAGLGWLEAVSPCTLVNESLFFSFRRTTQRKEPDYGRQISAIVVA
jgi:YfiH family protein